jgi:hypothetical protein
MVGQAKQNILKPSWAFGKTNTTKYQQSNGEHSSMVEIATD